MSLPLRIALVAEDRRGAWVAKSWTIRQLCRRVPWAEDALETQDELALADIARVVEPWADEAPLGLLRWLRPPDRAWWTHGEAVPAPARRTFGHLFHGRRSIAGRQAVRALMFFHERAAEERPDVVMIARDSDQHADRTIGYAPQDVPDRVGDMHVVLAMATPDIEAGLIAGLDGVSDVDARRAELRVALGFDPVATPHDLSSSPSSERNAKSVYARLAGGEKAEASMEARALMAPLEDLARHEQCGIKAFLDAVDRTIVDPIDPHWRHAETRDAGGPERR